MSIWMVPGYTEIRQLGQGGTGRVMLAVHDLTGVPVAIKYLADSLTDDDTFIREFRAEAHVLAELDSPYVTKMYEYVESEGRAAIVMELVDGVSMRAIIREQGAIEPDAALVVLKGSLLGLAAAHRRRVVHRDYKPENVLVDMHGQSKLADFGIAVRAGHQGILAGTPSYMAPEQWASATATPQTDIYAATATFFECLTGRPPYSAPGDRNLLRLRHEQDRIPVDLAPDAVHGLLHRGLAKDAAKRPKDATKFLRELEFVASEAYGAAWEAEGTKKLARRVALLVLLLPRPKPKADVTTASSSFAWTRLRKTSMVLAALVVLVAGGVMGRVAFADQRPASHTLPDASISMPPTLLDPAIFAPSPSPTASPSLSPAPPTPSATPSRPRKQTQPAKPPAKPSATATTAPASPPPKPTFGALAVQGDVFSSTCGRTTCWWMGWKSTARAVGTGPAILHIRFYPTSASGVMATKPSAQWDIDFTVVQTGSITWDGDAKYFDDLADACQNQADVVVQGSITVAGATTISAQSSPKSCTTP